ncbi:MAG: response regulator transcription factor [Clostridiales bacterium]|nr:response regulator transcription factor [Clostridiales bacterium]
MRLGQRILLAEDDAFLRGGLSELLGREGYRVDACASAAEAKRSAERGDHHLVVMDIGLPDGDGIELCRIWRAAGRRWPILFLTACDEELSVVRALDVGGDDYVTKPFRMLELLSRIRALLRRDEPAPISGPGLEVDAARMSVRRDGEAVFLTPIEFRLLSALLRGGGRILTREVLLSGIWDDGGQFVDDNTLSVHIRRLREKIGAERIRTVRGVGYRWEDS